MALSESETGSRDNYRLWASGEVGIPIWHQPWWLDATAGDNEWDVLSVIDGGQVAATLPYTLVKRRGFTVMSQPPLTQSLGPWFSSAGEKGVPKLSMQHKLLGQIADSLPKVDSYRQNWLPEMGNWLPFHWRGFDQTTRYTYRLNLGDGGKNLWQNLEGSSRREIRKGGNRNELVAMEVDSLDLVWPVIRNTFERQGRQVPFPRNLLERILVRGSREGAVSLYLARDANETTHAAAVVVRDSVRAYYLLGGTAPGFRTTGGMSLLLWNALQDAQDRGLQIFDFEGSMIEPVERFFRTFGAVQTPYFRVSKDFRKTLRLLRNLRGA
jgi:CelD/BcsL family acetyltransferase involved in cellulose biosynthesis